MQLVVSKYASESKTNCFTSVAFGWYFSTLPLFTSDSTRCCSLKICKRSTEFTPQFILRGWVAGSALYLVGNCCLSYRKMEVVAIVNAFLVFIYKIQGKRSMFNCRLIHLLYTILNAFPGNSKSAENPGLTGLILKFMLISPRFTALPNFFYRLYLSQRSLLSEFFGLSNNP